MEETTPNDLVILSPLKELDKYVPIKALKELVDAAGGTQESSKHATKETLLAEVNELVSEKRISPEQVSKLVENYKFAGRVSVCWGIPLERSSSSREELQQIILSKSTINPFETEIKPQLTQKPAFNQAQWIDDDVLRLEFTYAGKFYEVEDNYKRRTIVPTKRINSYLRLLGKTFVVETRASIRESKLLYNSISLLLGMEIVSMTFAHQDISFLKRLLDAKSKAVKSKRFGGDLDTIYVSASPTLDNLDDCKEYQDNFTKGEFKEARLEFSYTSPLGRETISSLHISSQGSIWFMSDVPEELIEYVFSVVRRIKFLPPVKKLGLVPQVSSTDENKIQSLINAIRQNGYGTRFNPRIYKTLGFEIDEQKWIATISKLVQLGHLTENFELVCPSCHETISTYSTYQEIPLDSEISCTHCGYEFILSEQNIVLIYSFKDDLESAK